MIKANSKVTLHFSLALENGDLVDSTFGHKPATFTMGDGSLLPGFEKHLPGLNVGEKHSFLIPQQDGFGAVNPQNIQLFKRSIFASNVELAEGLIVSFADAAGAELPGVVKKISDNEVEVDFNHPLAGHEITFTVEIIHVE
jgi:FKBP-type peptidyl-prolyl cis-trans isomerase SlpA